MGFPPLAVTLDPNFAILCVQNLLFGCVLPPFSHPGTILSAWGHPGGPWEQQEGHVGVRSNIETFSGHHFESFLSSNDQILCFCWSLCPGHFLHRVLSGII